MKTAKFLNFAKRFWILLEVTGSIAIAKILGETENTLPCASRFHLADDFRARVSFSLDYP